jgi:hypothetical protein
MRIIAYSIGMANEDGLAMSEKADVLQVTLYPAMMRLDQRGLKQTWDRMAGILQALLQGKA